MRLTVIQAAVSQPTFARVAGTDFAGIVASPKANCLLGPAKRGAELRLDEAAVPS
jgi:hypothetical protein